MSGGLTPCRQLRPSSRREHVRTSNYSTFKHDAKMLMMYSLFGFISVLFLVNHHHLGICSWQSLVDGTEQANLINVVRGKLLDGFGRAILRKRFSPGSPLSIKFMDEVGVAEGAVDGGGPTREFFTMVFHEISRSGIFAGPDESRILGCVSQPLSCVKFVVNCPITTKAFHNPCRALKSLRRCR